VEPSLVSPAREAASVVETGGIPVVTSTAFVVEGTVVVVVARRALASASGRHVAGETPLHIPGIVASSLLVPVRYFLITHGSPSGRRPTLW